MDKKVQDILSKMTLEDKISLCNGADFWHSKAMAQYGIPAVTMSDGPHGVRCQKNGADMLGVNESEPATCFPTAVTSGATWDAELLKAEGQAIGEEGLSYGVDVVLGPGVNIKRNPLGGRCFEYWSEDPYLAGHEAVGIVAGVQSKGVGTSLKHFAANNQETDRLRVSANISQRALREIYFPAFEHIVKTAQPWTIMCSYNRINGVHSAQNRWLLTDVLRDEWGYEGIVMSDWGADHDRVASLNAGLNLEMPPSYTDDQIVYAARDGRIQPEQLDRMAQGMVDLVNKTRAAMSVENYRFDVDAHDEVAHQAAIESMVLLKNDDDILPVAANAKIAVIGEFARTPRYQGGGSSHITPTKMTSFLDTLVERGADVAFAPGFTLDLEPADAKLEAEAVETAKNADVVLMFLGLPEAAESEGFDRETLDIPAKQVELLKAVAAENKNIVVVLSNGSVVSVAPWAGNAKGILESWLLGQAGGPALADVIFGKVSPSGKLAQTIPMDINDDPSMINWPGEEGHVDYGEGVFVGYRYYDTYDKAVDYPFGFGLSYATFAIDGVNVAKTGANTAHVTATVTNTSDVDAAETVQVYVAPGKAAVARPKHELKGFRKVFLKAGESAEISFDLDERAFAYWSEKFDDWHVEAGEYTVEVGTSSRDIAAVAVVTLDGDGKAQPLTEWSNFMEWRKDPLGSKVLEILRAEGEAGRMPVVPDNDMTRLFLDSMPINSMSVLMGADGKRIFEYMLAEYAELTK